ncbi:cupredoxin domain-containing protein [Neobacillus sp. PS3-12]|uniref:cupredoxin domain-containing protein n=1 Tax=Neobacillus sp. PS3-12 TaxID=3070677 RepID=UPI0027E13EDF|nr:cupredoxin domain-containing protein [Neobacillus sp. PS3-12]WML52793.1 cupredoxin domain-containing protein [Neobacillus sp. PS3-12]
MNTITFITIAAVFIISAYVIYQVVLHKEKLTNLNGVVIAMTTASMTGIISSYLIGVLSEDLFLACGAGMIIGFTIGFLGGQPVGIMPILLGSSSGFMGGIAGALLGVSVKTENPYLLMLIILIFYVILLSLVILFIHVLANKKLTLDTRTISPFAILSAGVVLLSLFFFLFSSDIINTNDTAATSQAQTVQSNGENSNTSTANNSTKDSTASIEADVTKETVPKVKMEVTQTGYSPNVIRVKKGVPVELDVHNPLENSCLSILNMPDFNMNNVNLKVGTTTLTFTPSNSGEYTFSCGMDMFKGKIIVE